MRHIAGWFRRNSTLMAQLQEEKDSYGYLRRITATWQNECQDKGEVIALLLEALIKARLALTNEPLRYECEQAIRKAKYQHGTLKGEYMRNKISFIRIHTMVDGSVVVRFFPSGRKVRTYEKPTGDSLYRVLNNDMVYDINPFIEQNGLMLEIYPKY